jgi:putative Mg2+ transporter-C (MgtC) family protein
MWLQLALAVVLGGLVGLEREFHGRAAGLRTHILVCLGSTVVMIAGAQVARVLPARPGGPPVWIDPGRIAAGILTGIGFIGAGAILRLRGTHRGLTTAACTWLVASIGIVLGLGVYLVAIAGTVLALLVLLVLHEVEKVIPRIDYRELVVVAELADDMPRRVHDVVERLGVHARAGEFDQDLQKREVRILYNVMYRGAETGELLARHLRELPGVKFISWRLLGI